MSKKKIIISNYDDIHNPHYGGGGAIVVHEIAKRLVNYYDVTVITGAYKGSNNKVVEGIYYERIGTSLFGPKIGQLIFSILLFFTIGQKKFDVWMESFTPPFSTSLLPLMTKKPVIGLVYMLVGREMKRKYKLPFDLFEKFGLQKYKYIIAPTPNVKEEVLKINSKATVFMIPHGIEATQNSNKISVRNKEVVFIGRIEIDQKGLDLLLKAFAILAQHIPNKLIIAGSGIEIDKKNLQKLIKNLHLSKRVFLKGRVEGEIKKDIINNAACIVIPSRFETFSMVALEALSAGIPLITYDIEGLKWIPSDVRITVTPFSIKDLSTAISDVLTNETVRQQLQEKGEQYAKKFTWPHVTKQYQSVIDDLVN